MVAQVWKGVQQLTNASHVQLGHNRTIQLAVAQKEGFGAGVEDITDSVKHVQQTPSRTAACAKIVLQDHGLELGLLSAMQVPFITIEWAQGFNIN